MRMFTQHEETTELIGELEVNEIEYTLAEQNKIFIDVNNGDILEGIWKVQYYPYWTAYKMIYYYPEGNEIKEARTVAFSIEQVIENILAD